MAVQALNTTSENGVSQVNRVSTLLRRRSLLPSVNGSPSRVTQNIFKSDGALTSERVLRVLAARLEGYKHAKEVLTFNEYLDLVLEKPELMLRPISRYAYDAVDYIDREFGSRTVKVLGQNLTEHSFLELPWKPQELKSIDRFRGHPLFWNDVRNRLKDFSRMAHPSHMMVVHGPNSTGKSCAFDAFFEMLEYYSGRDEGAVYTYEWAFDDKLSKMGFRTSNDSDDERMNQQDIVLSIPANKNSMPVFLLDLFDEFPEVIKEIEEEDSACRNEHDTAKDEPSNEELEEIKQPLKLQLLDQLITEGKLPEDFNKEFIASFGVDDMSRKIFKGLVKLYYEKDAEPQEVLTKVLRHLQVTRRYFSCKGGKGLVLKQPIDAPNTVLRPIIASVNWDRLPPQIVNVLMNAGVYSLEGALATSNHGVYYLDDGFRGHDKHRGLNPYLYILRLAEKGDVNVSSPDDTFSVNEKVDVIHATTVNDSRLAVIREEDPENFEAIQQRLDYHKIEHERIYRYIEDLYYDKLAMALPPETKRHVSPNVIHAFALWITMTHLFPYGNESHYNNLTIDADKKKRLKELLKDMTLLEKALLYNGDDLNAFEADPTKFKYKAEDQKLLHDNAKPISEEFNIGFGENNLEIYEGCIGLPTRVGDVLLAQIVRTKPEEPLTVLELFDTLDKACDRTFKFELQRNQLVAKISGQDGDDKKGGKDKASQVQIASIPSFQATRDLLNLVTEYIKRKIRFDVCDATGFRKSKEEIRRDLIKYLMHAKASLKDENVAEEYREPRTLSKANLEILRGMEKIFGIQESRAIDFRGELLRKIAFKQLEMNEAGGGASAMEQLDEILPEQAKKLEAEYSMVNKEGIKNFVSDLKEYLSNGRDEKRIIAVVNDPKRWVALKQGIRALEEKGYDLEIIVKEVLFAFKGEGII